MGKNGQTNKPTKIQKQTNKKRKKIRKTPGSGK
jgi:hypothetical protein